MHKSAMRRMKWFVENYIPKDKKVKVLDVGSYNVNGSYRQLFNGSQVEYVGLDLSKGPNVDFIPKDPYSWNELPDESFDFIISGNAFEHIEYPWLTIKEIYKKLKPEGFACILTPFALGEHRYPTDCYRYYSDGFKALAKWGGFKIVEVTVGGIPKEGADAEWSNTSENYDDTMMVIAKTDNEAKLMALPRFNKENRINKWTLK